MIHEQHVISNNQEFMKICSEHPKCINCPLKNEDVQLQRGLTRCITGRNKKGVDS